jgi:hypothetical protein
MRDPRRPPTAWVPILPSSPPPSSGFPGSAPSRWSNPFFSASAVPIPFSSGRADSPISAAC